MADLLIELQKAKRKQQEEKSEEQAPERPSTKSAVSIPERRQVSVMSCQLVASSTSSEALDPEELHALLPEYQSLCAKVIARYEGQIIQSFGDGILVYFGYPNAHEDDPRRACRTWDSRRAAANEFSS
jgi:class 3 adenylate cyclase